MEHVAPMMFLGAGYCLSKVKNLIYQQFGQPQTR